MPNPSDCFTEEIFQPLDSTTAALLDALEHLNAEPFDRSDEEWIAGFPPLDAAEPLLTDAALSEIRTLSRQTLRHNPFAVGAIENRVNFVIGKGHRYLAVPTSDSAQPIADAVQHAIDRFAEQNRWYERQQEIMRRKDRDGEAFLRFFRDDDSHIVVRFVEPQQIRTPRDMAADPQNSLGIQTDPLDAENVLGYWIDETFVPATVVQHRKSNVDANVKRGMPLLWPVRKNLERAEKLLRNMSVVAEIQSAIALIRKHAGSSADSVRQYVQSQAVPRPSAEGMRRQKFSPGTIIDANAGVDYQFPIAAVDAARYIQILQAELRAIASRLVMPEFMLSCDASNANYSSTMIAEGPAVRMFERLQTEMIRDDLAVLRRVIDNDIAFGFLPPEAAGAVAIQAIPPTLAVRDRLSEAQADEILLKNGILSPQTMAMRYGLDPDKENRAACCCPCHDPS